MITATTTAQIARNFINGQWVDSSSGRTVERRNPANLDEVVAVVPLSSREEANAAVAAARAAFPAWRDTPAPVRGRVIAKAAAISPRHKARAGPIFAKPAISEPILIQSGWHPVNGAGGRMW